MENRDYARILYETADLMEIAGDDGFRIRSYRNGASTIEGYTERIADILANPEAKITDVPGIGKGLAAVLGEIDTRGSCERRDELLRNFRSEPYVFDIVMDIGAYRDLHRHRRCQQFRQGYSS